MSVIGLVKASVERLRRSPAGVAFFLLLAVAFAHAQAAVRGTTRPLNMDLFRDMSQARAILDGRWWQDPFYAGERLWYNPLVPGLVGLLSRLSGLALPEAYARGGPWINLIAPVAFFFLGRRLFGSSTALAASVAFLFVTSNDLPSQYSATYSPWLYAANAAQGLFYFALLAYVGALDKGTLRSYAAAGALAGLTLLAHSAPAGLLAGIVLVETLARGTTAAQRPEARPDFMRSLVPTAGLAATSLVVSLPLLQSVLFHYRLAVKNPAPGSWIWEPLRLGNEGSFLRAHLLAPEPLLVALIATVGVVAASHSRDLVRSPGRLVLFWLMICLAGLVWGHALQILAQRRDGVRGLFPSHHFLLYLRGAGSLLFGLGIVHAARGLRSLARGRGPERAWVALLICAVGLAAFPSYRRRDDLVQGRAAALAMSNQMDEIRLTDWIERNTPNDAVILAPDPANVIVIGPTGRRVAALHAAFANPYVDHTLRARKAAALLDALNAGDQDTFHRGCRAEGITHLVTAIRGAAPPPEVPGMLRLAFVSGGWAIYSVLSSNEAI